MVEEAKKCEQLSRFLVGMEKSNVKIDACRRNVDGKS